MSEWPLYHYIFIDPSANLEIYHNQNDKNKFDAAANGYAKT